MQEGHKEGFRALCVTFFCFVDLSAYGDTTADKCETAFGI